MKQPVATQPQDDNAGSETAELTEKIERLQEKTEAAQTLAEMSMEEFETAVNGHKDPAGLQAAIHNSGAVLEQITEFRHQTEELFRFVSDNREEIDDDSLEELADEVKSYREHVEDLEQKRTDLVENLVSMVEWKESDME